MTALLYMNNIAVLTRMRYRSIAQVHEFQGFSQSRCTSYVQEPLYELSKQLKLLAIQITHADSLHDLKFVYAVITMFNNKVSVFKHSKREYSIHYNIRDHILNKLNSCIATGNNFKVREELMKLMTGQGLPVLEPQK